MPFDVSSPSSVQRDDRNAYINCVLETHDVLKQESDFSPANPRINRHLSRFVRATMQSRSEADIEAILSTPRIQGVLLEMRVLLSRAEYEMECFCAAAMTGKSLPASVDHRYASYENFIYRDNYRVLIANEMRALGWPRKQPALNRDLQSIAFVGAGPLPISAIMLHLRTGIPITCIDSDAAACELGRNLIRRLSKQSLRFASLGDNISYAHGAGDAHDFLTHPVVFIASLVDRKDPVIMRIVNTSRYVGGSIVVRSAEGLSTLLYPPFDCPQGMEEYNFYFSKKTMPCPFAINTSLIFKFPPGKYFSRHKLPWEGSLDDHLVPKPRGRRMRTRPYDLAI